MPEAGGEKKISYPIRLNRYIAACGVAARRKADGLIASGRVTVDGVTETSLGRVLREPAVVSVDGREIGVARPVCIAMNKPRGVLSAVSDERERTVVDLLPAFYRSLGVFPVGRLDRDSEGLIVLTNDGAFAQELIHPSKGVPRTYLVRLRYGMDEAKLAEWRCGVVVEGRRRAPLDVTREADDAAGRCFRVVLGEGFKREIRLMAGALGNRVVRLRRIAIGKLFLEKLSVGAFCEYNCEEMLNMILSGGQV